MAKKRKSITQEIMEEAKKICNKERYPNDVTRKAHLKNIYRFISFARSTFGARTLAECLPHVQEYADFLVSKNYSPASIHTMVSAACSPLRNDIRLCDIRKPVRKASEIRRGRDLSKRTITSLEDPANQKLVRFAKAVGLRKNDYRHLTNSSFTYDTELNSYIIFIKKSKGGKKQYQKIFDEDVDFVKSYFDPNGAPDDRIFKPSEFKKLNLHRLRALRAQELYEKLEKKILEDEGFAKILEREMEIYWNRFKNTPFPKDKMTKGYYYLRGDVRKDAIARHKKTCYLRIAVNFVSFFTLSHMRPGVCVLHYLLA